MLAVLAFFGFRSSRNASYGPEKGAISAGSTANSEAREAYLKGRYFWDKRTVDGFKKAGEYFKQAIALDPNFAQAYAGLGDSYHFLAGSSSDPQKDYFAKSKEAYRKALELNPELAGAHASLGLVTMNYDWDWLAAEQEFKRAIELDPDYATGHHWYAECLIALGRFDEGLHEIGLARELEPLSLIINTDMGKMLYYSRRFDEAKKQLKETLNLDPNFAAAHLWLGRVYTEQKEFDQAIAEFQTYGQLSGDKYVAGQIGFVYGRMGKQKEAEQAVDILRQSAKGAEENVCLGLGDKDCAIAGLEVSYAGA